MLNEKGEEEDRWVVEWNRRRRRRTGELLNVIGKGMTGGLLNEIGEGVTDGLLNEIGKEEGQVCC